jgi:competence protein ComGC
MDDSAPKVAIGQSTNDEILPPAAPEQAVATDNSQAPVKSPTVVQHDAPAGMLVLQWLTYAFWGWTVLTLSFLTASVLTSFILGAESGDFNIYAIAAVLVLLPAAFTCDVFYSRKEPVKKTGAALAVMAIHAVLFALIAMGTLITAVFTVVSMFVSAGESDGKIVALTSSLIICVYYVLIFLRTLNPVRLSHLRKAFRFCMLGFVLLMTVLGIVGPIAKEREVRNDKLIEANVSQLATEINNYTNDNNELPDTLNQLDLEGDVALMVSKNLIVYKPNTKTAIQQDYSYSNSSRSSLSGSTYYYQLCANFKKASRYYSSYNTRENSEYRSYVYATQHPAGEYCYKVSTSGY